MLNKENYFKVKPLFKSLSNHLSIFGVIHRINKGYIYVDDEQNPKSAFLISPEGFYLGGVKNESFYKKLNEVLKNKIFKEALDNKKEDYVCFYPNLLENSIHTIFKSLYPMKDIRHYYELETTNHIYHTVSNQVVKINKKLFNQALDGLQDIKEQIENSWFSLDQFMKNGLGYVSIKNNKIISWCISDTVVGNRCELGIETDEAYRQKGYGFETLISTLNECKKRNIKKVGWHCWKSNIPSIKTASKAGFKLIEEIQVSFGLYNKYRNYITNGNHYLMNERDDQLSAKFYALALDNDYGQLWHYYNASCLLYKLGQIDKAKTYYKKAVDKGWKGLNNWNKDWLKWVYHDEDAIMIENILQN